MILPSLLGYGEVLDAQLWVLATIIATSFLSFFVVWRARKLYLLKPLTIPLLFFLFAGSLDALATLHGTWFTPAVEENPATRVLIERWGWQAICGITILWGGGLIIMVTALGELEGIKKLSTVVRFIRLWLIYAVASGHFMGFNTWIAGAPLHRQALSVYSFTYQYVFPLIKSSGIGATLYIGAFLGVFLALIHMTLSYSNEKNRGV